MYRFENNFVESLKQLRGKLKHDENIRKVRVLEY